MPVPRIALCMLTCLTMPVAACAEEALVITVNPSGIELEESGSRDRLERLSRRFDQTEHAFRHICVSCGAAKGPGDVTAPFNPMTTLAQRKSDWPMPAPAAEPVGDGPESEKR